MLEHHLQKGKAQKSSLDGILTMQPLLVVIGKFVLFWQEDTGDWTGAFGSSGGENCGADGFGISSLVSRLSWLLATCYLPVGGILFMGSSCTLLRLGSDPSVVLIMQDLCSPASSFTSTGVQVFVRCWNMFACSPWLSFLSLRVDLLSYCFLCMSCRFCSCSLWLSKACVHCRRPVARNSIL